MRLIDCRTGEIVEAEPAFRWVALSYVWGDDASKLSTQRPPGVHDVQISSSIIKIAAKEADSEAPHKAAKRPLKFPATVKDAMTVTLELGYQYLWCDAYCINQEDEVHKADQISKMDRIYRCAVFTIVATGPSKHHGLPGVSTVRASSLPISTLLTSCAIRHGWHAHGLSKKDISPSDY
jgi:hypothetical protein